MQHIDQKLLELYVLNDESALQQRDKIETHLAECAGCRELYARMEDHYAGFFNTMEDSETRSQETSISTKKSLSILSHPSPLQEIRANYQIDRSPMRRTVAFIRRHPVVSSTISLFTIGFFALLGLQLFDAFKKVDDNPVKYRYTSLDRLELYNNENKLLWYENGINLFNIKDFESQQNIHFTEIVDIDNDGINEVVTTLNLTNHGMKDRSIKLFDKTGILLKSVSMQPDAISFRNIHYYDNIGWSNFISQKKINSKFNFFVYGGTGRSPSLVVNIDNFFNMIGQYWHFGHFQFIKQSDIDNDGKNEIVLLGKNDVDDMKFKDFPIMVVLEPDKLLGIEESSVTTGFGLKRSNAELYYIKFPETDMERYLKVKSFGRSIVNDNNNILQINISVGNTDPNANFIGFDYIFSKKDMSVIEVKFVSETERTHRRLKMNGRIQSEFNKEYLDMLKNSVKYWNGENWMKAPTKISPPPKSLRAR